MTGATGAAGLNANFNAGLFPAPTDPGVGAAGREPNANFGSVFAATPVEAPVAGVPTDGLNASLSAGDATGAACLATVLPAWCRGGAGPLDMGAAVVARGGCEGAVDAATGGPLV